MTLFFFLSSFLYLLPAILLHFLHAFNKLTTTPFDSLFFKFYCYAYFVPFIEKLNEFTKKNTRQNILNFRRIVLLLVKFKDGTTYVDIRGL
jgi:hypothetical protein